MLGQVAAGQEVHPGDWTPDNVIRDTGRTELSSGSKVGKGPWWKCSSGYRKRG